MKKLKQKKWMVYSGIGLYLILSPFTGFPTTLENAIYVVLGSVILWLSMDKDRTAVN